MLANKTKQSKNQVNKNSVSKIELLKFKIESKKAQMRIDESIRLKKSQVLLAQTAFKLRLIG